MISVDEALAHILSANPAPAAETVPLAAGHGRILAAPLTAAHSQPPFDSSAMDGYAVRAEDVVPGRSLRMVGTAQAGQRFVGVMGRGQCVRIFTGAPMPFGADAVIMQEETTVDGALIGFRKPAAKWQSVRRRGSDFEQGEELLPTGARMTPAALALAAAANRPQLTVTRRPRVALLATGDELRVPGSTLGPDQIVASNAYGLMPMLAPFAERVVDLGIVPDDRDKLDAALLRAFDDGAEVIVTTGGASVGDRDYVHDVLVDLGVDLQFWKIAMRPGKPLMFGRRGRSLVFGLPGNPVSSLVTATVLLLPALRALCGDPNAVPPQHAVPLTTGLAKNESGRRHFMRGTLGRNALGFLEVTPMSETDSAHTSSLGRADVLIVQPENHPGLPGGELVEIIPLPQ
jgi:molybdopterin molybdotransferase